MSHLKHLLVFTILLFVFFGGIIPAGDGYKEISSSEPKFDYSITNFQVTPDGMNIIAGSNYGVVAKFNIRTGEKLWEKTVNSEKQDIYALAISPNGKDVFVSSVISSVGSTSALVILNTENGNIIRTIVETSLYCENPLKQEGLDFRFKTKEEYPDYEMSCKYVSFTSDGKLLTHFTNAKSTYGMFDRSFRAYSSSYQKLWSWQVVSKNNDGERNGLYSAYPLPSMDSDGKGNFYCGDSDGDFYQVSETQILAQQKKLYITDKDPGKKLLKRPQEEDIGIRKIIIKGSKAYLYYDGSGAPSFVGIYDLSLNKLVSPLKEVDSAIDNMEISANGYIGLQNMNDFEVYNSSMSKKVATIPGTRARFNPVNQQQVIYYDRGAISVVELE